MQTPASLLVVDDSKTTRVSLQRHLEHEGYRVKFKCKLTREAIQSRMYAIGDCTGIAVTEIRLKGIDPRRICAAGKYHNRKLQHQSANASHRRHSITLQYLLRFRSLVRTVVLTDPYKLNAPLQIEVNKIVITTTIHLDLNGSTLYFAV